LVLLEMFIKHQVHYMVTLTQVLVQTHLMVYMVPVDLDIQLTNSQLQLE
jgi:hypothetical protein